MGLPLDIRKINSLIVHRDLLLKSALEG